MVLPNLTVNQLKKAERGHPSNLVERDIHYNVLDNTFYKLNLSVDELQACEFELGVTVFLLRLEHAADIIDECTV